jgi:glucose/mannose-6-phosphate isomerase
LNILDQPALWPAIDPQAMRTLMESFPVQFRNAAAAVPGLSLPRPARISNVIVAGLGGSAIGGDVVRSAVGASLRVPMVVCRDYCLPGFADSSSLIFACSYSGNTEETLSAYQQARRIGASIICITSGGKLRRLADSDGVPIVTIPGGMPPRCALGYSSIALLGCLTALSLVSDQGVPLSETASLLGELALRYGAGAGTKDNPAKRLAELLHGKVVVVYAATGLLEAAAARWRGQIEENAKNLAGHHVLPEMNHNEILGWEFPENRLDSFGVVLLRDRHDHPQVQRRFDLTRQIIGRRAGSMSEVWSEGESPMARLFSTIYLGDFVSLYLAFLNGVDPTRIDAIDFLKEELTRSS